MMECKKVTRGNGFLEGFLSRWRTKVANKLIPDTHRLGRILDIGCGNYPFFLLHTDFTEKYGIDKVIKTEDAPQLEGQRIFLKNCDLEKENIIPYDDNYFDVVTMLAVCEHIHLDCFSQVLIEIHRILKPNRACVITTPASWTFNLLRVLAKVNIVSKEEIDEHKEAYSKDKLEYVLQIAGFEKEKIHFGFFQFFMNSWMIAIK